MFKAKILFLLIQAVIILTLSGCGSTSSSSTSSGGIQTAHLIDSAVSGVEYQCIKDDNTVLTRGITNSTGDFDYKTDCTVKFTLGKITITSLTGAKITQLTDNDVYITDAVGVDRNDTNDSRVVNILRVLQSLDSDDNPENGIDINQTVRYDLNSSTINQLTLTRTDLTEGDLNNTVKAGNSSKELITSTKAIAHFEEVLRNKAGLIIDTVPPAKPIVLTYNTDPIIIPTATGEDITKVQVIGEKGSKVYVNGTYEGNISTTTGKLIVDLNTTGNSISSFPFDILLQDEKEQNSSINHIVIFKDNIAPAVPQNDINVTINEQQNFVKNIFATDASALTYGIVTSADDNRSTNYQLFQIDSNGSITFIVEPNYDQTLGQSYNVVVYAKDAAQRPTYVRLTVNIQNILDNPPTLTNTTYTANNIMEKTADGTVIFDANTTLESTAIAPDNEYNYRFSLLNGTNEFDINSTTGVISIKDNTQPLFDYETSPNTYNLQLRVTNDNNTSAGNTVDANITVNIINHIDTEPALDTPSSVNLNEKSTTGTTFATITKSLLYNDSNTTMLFSIVNGNDGNFTIDPTTGVVSTSTQNLDFETVPTYTLTIRATNTWWDSSTHTDDVNLTINLLDQIDNAPILANPSSTIILPENTANGTTVAQIDLNGTNADENTTVSYYIDTASSSGNYNNFTINSSGLITTNAATLTYDETDSNSSITATRLAIKATNTAYNGATLTSSPVYLDINITNVIDNAPVISVSSTSLSIDENTTIGTTIATVNKAGTIWDENQTDSFTLYDDNSSGKFAINSTTGVVTLAGALDWETANSYSFKVKATNTAGDSNILTFTVTINNIVEQAPIITLKDTILNIHENTDIDTKITYIKEPINTDINSSDVTIIDDITIASGNEDDKFKIQIQNNIAYIMIKNSLDYETNSSFHLSLVGTNSFGNSAEQNLTINIIDDVDRNIPLLVIGIQYDDINFTSSLTDIQNLITYFHDDGDYLNDSKLNNYFQAVSNHKFNFKAATESYDTDPVTNGIVVVNLQRNHPKDNAAQLEADIKNALIAADDNVTFSTFDTNGDGNITTNELQLLFVVAGGEVTYGDTNQSISAVSGTFDSPLVLDGKELSTTKYAAVGERNGANMASIGLIAKYLAKNTFNFKTTGMGNFGLMGTGYRGSDANQSNIGEKPVFPCAYNRLSQGWVFLNTLNAAGDYDITFDTANSTHVDTHEHIIKIPSNDANLYYLIENRNTNTDGDELRFYDNGLYFINNSVFSGGLAIWKIYNDTMSILNIDSSNDHIFRTSNSTGDLPIDTNTTFQLNDRGTIDSTTKTYTIGIKVK